MSRGGCGSWVEEALSPKPRPSRLPPGHRIDPSLLRGWSIRRVKHVWSTDITSLRLRAGCIDVVAVLDWVQPVYKYKKKLWGVAWRP